MNSQKNTEIYISRINKVIDHIETNIDKELSLESLAKVAGFSRFYFHRIFGAMMGETLNHFIARIRVEKAAAQLLANPGKSITEIAFDCGFSGPAPFARVFKERYEMNAGQWRNGGWRKICKTNDKDCKTIGKDGKDFHVASYYVDGVSKKHPTWRTTMNNEKVNIEVKEMPEMPVAYVRHVGPYAGMEQVFEQLFTKLMSWAGPRGLLQFPKTQILSVYHDDPKITEEDKLRVSACITVPKDAKVDGQVGKMTIKGGKYAVGRFELSSDEFAKAWEHLMGTWLPQSGYQPDDGLCYELCHNDPKNHPQGKHIVDICVPVKPL